MSKTDSPQAVQSAVTVDRRGTAFGWFNMVVGLALLPASVVFGVLYESLSPTVAFGFSGACAFSACVLLWRWFGQR